MSFAKGSKGFSTIMGVSPDKFAKIMGKEKVDAIGANCSLSIKDFVDIVKIMKMVTGIPLWVKPNAGSPQIKNGKTFYPDSPQYMAGYVKNLIEAGARIIGGCCGTTPRHIKSMIEQRNKIVGAVR
jgi:methionine synthase I (cobalamin-dependent)